MNQLSGISNRYRNINKGTVLSYFVLLLLIIINAILQPTFFSSFNLTSLLNNSLPMILVAAGELFVILTGGIDLSIGAIISIVNTYIATHMQAGIISETEVVVIALFIGTLSGFVNGVIIHFARLQPILVTLATMSVYEGISLLIMASPGGSVPADFTSFWTGTVLGIPVAFIIIILLILGWLWFQRTNLLLHIVSFGSDRSSAFMNGIKPGWITVITYSISGLFSAFAGIYVSAQTTSGDPNIGNPYTLLAIASVVIGGASLSGGKGNMWGVISGAIILNIIGGLIYFSGISSFYQDLIQGLILLFAVSFSSLQVSRNKYSLK